MSQPAIVAAQLGKRYRLGRAQGACSARGGMLRRLLRRPIAPGAAAGAGGSDADSIWALCDLDFTIQPGEVVGFIGRNGAGKSTLLKVLSRVVTPTTGRVVLRGRVGSLLEVGTGFHPELTGRENIFLNGAILGMRRIEIQRKFDEIVAFSEIERFLDTPVKRYSSGMYVRLAFAVAAHLDPDILLVDEVLAVGDASFQRKCLGVMNEVATQGRTVLFVSHNMPAVQALCPRSVVLQAGRIVFDGPTDDALSCYAGMHENPSTPLAERSDRQGHGAVRAVGMRLLNRHGKPVSSIGMGEPFTVEVETRGHLPHAVIGVMLGNMARPQIIRGYTWEQVRDDITLGPANIVTCDFAALPLLHGSYGVHVWIGQRGIVADYVENAALLMIEPRDVFGTGRIPDANGGVAYSKVRWDIAAVEHAAEAPTPTAPPVAEHAGQTISC